MIRSKVDKKMLELLNVALLDKRAEYEEETEINAFAESVVG